MARSGAILIATVSVGAGHIRAAEAVREAIVAADPQRLVAMVDVLNFGPRWARRFYRDAFVRVAAISRRAAYGLYVGTDGETPDAGEHLFQRITYHRFRRFVEEGPWQDVICTHFLPCQVVDMDRRPAMHMVVTDYALHRYWLQPNVDNFFVATEAMAQTIKRRMPRVAAHATGIPVLERFHASPARDAARRELGIAADAPVVLIMGGGWGLGIEPMVRQALRANVDGLTTIVICGANADAYKAVSRMQSERLRAFAHVDDVAHLMAAADLVVSKPGGITTTEALAMHKPLLLTRGLPGHEDRNARELAALGVADVADERGLGLEIERFFHSPELRVQRINASQQTVRHSGAAAIAAHFNEVGERCA